jgi:hypothetical protein
LLGSARSNDLGGVEIGGEVFGENLSFGHDGMGWAREGWWWWCVEQLYVESMEIDSRRSRRSRRYPSRGGKAVKAK